MIQWRDNERDGISNHRHLDCLFNLLSRCRSKKTSKFRVIGLCEGNAPVTGEFPSQRASNAENVSIWWRHHGILELNLFSEYWQLSHEVSALVHISMYLCDITITVTPITIFMWPTRGQPGSCRLQVGPMLAPWTLLAETLWFVAEL